MSYQFTVKGGDKAAAKEALAAELEKVAAEQPAHKLDVATAHAAALTFIDLLPDNEARDVIVEVYGNVGGSWEADQLVRPLNVTFKVTVNLPKKPPLKDE